MLSEAVERKVGDERDTSSIAGIIFYSELLFEALIVAALLKLRLMLYWKQFSINNPPLLVEGFAVCTRWIRKQRS